MVASGVAVSLSDCGPFRFGNSATACHRWVGSWAVPLDTGAYGSPNGTGRLWSV